MLIPQRGCGKLVAELGPDRSCLEQEVEIAQEEHDLRTADAAETSWEKSPVKWRRELGNTWQAECRGICRRGGCESHL